MIHAAYARENGADRDPRTFDGGAALAMARNATGRRRGWVALRAKRSERPMARAALIRTGKRRGMREIW